MKKIYIDTLGCAKNTYDSQMLAAELVKQGCELVDTPEEADIMVVNTCGFIEDAKTESIERIFELVNVKNELEDKKLVVTGCLSQRYHKELAEEMPEVDMFFGVNEYENMTDILVDDNSQVRDGITNIEDDLKYRTRILPSGSYSGVLKIAEGCYNACSFCAIPAIRGKYRSKKFEDCIREAKDMAAEGIKELILIAQDTSQYGRDLYGKVRLPELLREICRIEGIEWVRLMYVYDNGITDELIETIATEPKICKYIDIPIQHIADNVLRRMRRQSSKASIIDCINRLRERIPEIHIRTTLLVGFPGETEEDFDELVDFIDTMKIDRLGAFAFSDEEGTPSYELDGKLDEETKENRRDIVMEHQCRISEELNEKKIDGIYEVIIDEFEGENICIGRTRFDAPEIDCEVSFTTDREHELGDIVKVRIENTYEYDLEGEEV
ncbi:MAG: 30S ribosomal protein S12 methylthiotransferase RimO [Clostridiales bacterium]|nr:30S ribosomal protein S12 methylthiotransferase RimO [Candidatus Crickella merdequi]